MTKKNGPWSIVKSVVKYKNPWMTVTEDKVIRPDGKAGIFGTVNMIAGISVLPIDNNNSVYLTKEFRYAVSRNCTELVSGGIETGESPEAAAKRELREELGIVANDLVSLGLVHPFTSAILSPAHLFLARGLQFKASEQEGTETIEMVKTSFERAYYMALHGEIIHAPSVIALLRAKHFI